MIVLVSYIANIPTWFHAHLDLSILSGYLFSLPLDISLGRNLTLFHEFKMRCLIEKVIEYSTKNNTK